MMCGDGCAVTKCSAARSFYEEALWALAESGVPFLVGGAFSLRHYTPVERDTKDLDVFLRKQDVPKALQSLAERGFRTELPFPHWLAKAIHEDHFVDLIFNSA